ncbi:MAG TPA: hypothetical protein VIT92_17340 [Burkholderiaceae bacterium]
MNAPMPVARATLQEPLPFVALFCLMSPAVTHGVAFYHSRLALDLAAMLAWAGPCLAVFLWSAAQDRKAAGRPARWHRATVAALLVAGAAAAGVYFYLDATVSPHAAVFHGDPLDQISQQGKLFKRLSYRDESDLRTYLANLRRGRVQGAAIGAVEGRTVANVLRDARVWRAAHPDA